MLRWAFPGQGREVFVLVVASVLLWSLGAVAQVPPAEQRSIERQLDQIQQLQQQQFDQRERDRRQSESPPVPLPPEAAPPQTAPSVCFTLRSVSFEGAHHLSEQDRTELSAPYLGRCVTIKEVNDLIRSITDLYGARGYVTTRATLPKQDVSAGVLTIRVMEGRIQGFRWNGEPADDRSEVVTAFPMGPGDTLNLRDTEQGLDQINRLRSNDGTGTPALDDDGGLADLDVQRGAVVIDGTTVDVTGLDFFDIVSRTASLNAAIKAQQLGVFTGAGRFDYASRTLSGNGDASTGVSIDSSALGGMYANRITLVGTDKGVGVNLQGEVSASDALTITADGKITGQLLQTGGGAMSLTSWSDAVVLPGTVYAGGTLSITGVSANLSGTIAAASDVTVQAANVDNSGQLVAGLNANGTVAAGSGRLSVAANQLDNSGTLQSGQATSVAANGLSNTAGGSINSLGRVDVATQSLDNQGQLAAAGDLSATAQGTLGNNGQISAGGTAQVGGGTLHSTGTITSAGAMTLSAGSATLAGQVTGGSTVSVAGNDLTVNGGLTAVGGLTVGSTGTTTIAGGATVVAGGDMTLTVGSLANSGTLSAGGALHASAQGDLANRAGGRMWPPAPPSWPLDRRADRAPWSNPGSCRAARSVCKGRRSAWTTAALRPRPAICRCRPAPSRWPDRPRPAAT
jgi:adhesin HecA-like repeat protein